MHYVNKLLIKQLSTSFGQIVEMFKNAISRFHRSSGRLTSRLFGRLTSRLSGRLSGRLSDRLSDRLSCRSSEKNCAE